jgi:hypothetical protein
VTTAPTGVLANSGWQYEGSWGVGAGTAIGPNEFITAKHLGGNVGDSFVLNGTSYTTVAAYADPNGSDLEIWKVAQTFSTYAPIYTGNADVNSTPLMTVFGRGTARGTDIVGPLGVNQGYNWGSQDGQMSWGLNRITFSTTLSNAPTGTYLGFEFNPNGWAGVSNPATLSAGDSGGGVFIQDTDGTWKLAGVNYAVDGAYSLSANSGYFSAAMYDAREYYVGGPGNYIYVSNGPSPVWQSAYASRISSSQSFINSVIGVPEPSSFLLIAVGAFGCRGLVRRQRRTGRGC